MMIARRVMRLKERVKIDAQGIRVRTLESLQEIFDLAASLARGAFKTQSEKGIPIKLTIGQRKIWARVAAYVAQIMNSIAEGFDEREIEEQLDELGKLVDEVAKAKPVEA